VRAAPDRLTADDPLARPPIAPALQLALLVALETSFGDQGIAVADVVAGDGARVRLIGLDSG
jgi:hypothetical protein